MPRTRKIATVPVTSLVPGQWFEVVLYGQPCPDARRYQVSTYQSLTSHVRAFDRCGNVVNVHASNQCLVFSTKWDD